MCKLQAIYSIKEMGCQGSAKKDLPNKFIACVYIPKTNVTHLKVLSKTDYFLNQILFYHACTA